MEYFRKVIIALFFVAQSSHNLQAMQKQEADEPLLYPGAVLAEVVDWSLLSANTPSVDCPVMPDAPSTDLACPAKAALLFYMGLIQKQLDDNIPERQIVECIAELLRVDTSIDQNEIENLAIKAKAWCFGGFLEKAFALRIALPYYNSKTYHRYDSSFFWDTKGPMKEVEKNYLFRCPRCQEAFDKKIDLFTHRELHKEESYHICHSMNCTHVTIDADEHIKHINAVHLNLKSR